MKAKSPPYRTRYLFIHFFLLLATLGLVWRMVDLTVLNRSFLKKQGDARTLRTINIPAYRGMISDRNGYPLAISTPVMSVWINPKEFKIDPQAAKEFSELLAIPSDEIKNRIAKHEKSEFIYLKRGLSPNIGLQIKALHISGVFLQREFRRFYPEGDVTAHLLGFTNIDEQGQEGLELAYDQWLRGSQGKTKVLKDRLGRIIANVTNIRDPKPGHDLILSIDKRIQFLANEALRDAVKKYNALSGSVVVLDTQNGEILALVNQPSFNPNRRPKVHDGRYRNRAVTDLFEPGSVMKAFSIAAVLENSKVTPDTLVHTSPGKINVDGNIIQDEHDNGSIDITEILKLSSNVGVSKLILNIPPEKLLDLLHKVGFGRPTASNFPGERAGLLVEDALRRRFTLATLSFGYGISVTPLQLAHAYTVFANQGVLLPVSLLRLNKSQRGQQILSSHVASQLLTMLEAVVKDGGTGRRAKVHGYRVAGKTATVRIAGPNGYDKNHHVASFVGIAPVSKPRLVIAVVIRDPRGEHYYSSQIAAPVFSNVMTGALRILNVAPDDIHLAKSN